MKKTGNLLKWVTVSVYSTIELFFVVNLILWIWKLYAKTVLTVLQNRRQIATLRSLGVKKRQIPAAVLSGLLLICLFGAITGGVLGHALSDRVAEYILDTAQVDLADTSFSIMLAKEDVEQEDLYAIAIQSQPEAAAFAAASVWVALALLCFILVIPESKKSPMLTLGARE